MGNLCKSQTRPAAIQEINPIDSLFATFGDDIAKFVVAEKSK